MSRTARRSARSCPSLSELIRVSRQTITTALATSATESSPNPISATEPARMPLTTADGIEIAISGLACDSSARHEVCGADAGQGGEARLLSARPACLGHDRPERSEPESY